MIFERSLGESTIIVDIYIIEICVCVTKEPTNMQLWPNVQYKSIFCDLYNYFEIWHFYQMIYFSGFCGRIWTISTAVERPKMLLYPMKIIIIRKTGRYSQWLLFQCNFFTWPYFNEVYHCSLYYWWYFTTKKFPTFYK